MIRRKKPFPDRRAPIKRGARIARRVRVVAVNPARQARRRKEYAAFLRSAAWKRIRAQKLAESATCELHHQGCVGAEQPTVHHTTYLRFGGKELMSDLQRACAPCHRFHDALAGRHA